MKPLSSRHAPDALADSLEDLRFRSVVFCLSNLGAPWGFGVDVRDFASFHLITSGSALLEVTGAGTLRVSAGDLVILPHGHGHCLRDQPSSPVIKLDRLLDGAYDADSGQLVSGGSGPVTTVLCGGFHQEGLTAQRLFTALPAIIHLKRGDYDGRMWTGLALDLLVQEAAAFRPGADAVIKRLAELLFVDAIRGHFASRDGARGQLVAGLHDPRIGRVLRALQRHPAAPWKLSQLAREAAMSRTAFACRFREVMGMPPGCFVTHIRLTQAADLLRSTHLPLRAIAERSGYRSDAAFSRSFKRVFGESPARYRTQRAPAGGVVQSA